MRFLISKCKKPLVENNLLQNRFFYTGMQSLVVQFYKNKLWTRTQNILI